MPLTVCLWLWHRKQFFKGLFPSASLSLKNIYHDPTSDTKKLSKIKRRRQNKRYFIQTTLGPLVCVRFRRNISISWFKSILWVLLILWVHVYTKSPCLYRDIMSPCQLNDFAISLSQYHGCCQFHESIPIPRIHVNSKIYLKVQEVPECATGA